jgi:type III restriction enzyme
MGKVQKKVLIRRDDLFATKDFQQFWQSMARTTRYTVAFDEDQLVQELVPQLRGISVHGQSADITSMRIALLEDSQTENPQVTTSYMGSAQSPLKARFAPQDWVQALSQDSRLSQKAVCRLLQVALQDQKCANQFLLNPALFTQQACALINRAEREHMLRGLHYTPTGETLPLDTLKAVVETVKEVAHTPERGLYKQQAIDSGQEKKFAESADKDLQLLCLLKLPTDYYILTPVGRYTPDFGLVFQQSGHHAMELNAQPLDKQVSFFVVEVKATHEINDTKALTEEEVLKIECAARHFQALGFATHIHGRTVHVQPQHLYAAPRDTYEYFKKTDVNTEMSA